MKNAPGTRVVAISSADDSKVYVFGFGTYEGDFVPEKTSFMTSLLADAGLVNPRIKLDSGKVVYGCECWWGPEDGFQERYVKGREVVTVEIDTSRAKAEGRS